VLSNNPLISPEEHARELNVMGLPVEPENVLTSVTALLSYLSREMPDKAVYVVGEIALLEHLRSRGIRLNDNPDEIACVVAAFDRTFNYQKWTTAFQAIRNGAEFVATNADATFPTADGEIPDCGGIIAALETSTGRRVSKVLGKPSRSFLSAALEYLQTERDRVLVVGDRLSTDISMGAQHQVDSALVMTGVTTIEDLETSPVRPTYVLDGVSQLLEAHR
jgi:NagD protein